MLQTKETIVAGPHEINFFGEGKARDIQAGFAILTIRKLGAEYNFSPGEIAFANCQTDSTKVPIVIIHNKVEKLIKFYEPALALDGFFSSEEAALALRRYPGYERVTDESKVQAFTFLDAQAFNSLSQSSQKLLVTEDWPDLMRNRALREIFFPTILFWLAEKDGTIRDWKDYLETYELVKPKELQALKNFEYHGTNLFEFLERHPEQLKYIARNPTSPLFEPMVLARFKK